MANVLDLVLIDGNCIRFCYLSTGKVNVKRKKKMKQDSRNGSNYCIQYTRYARRCSRLVAISWPLHRQHLRSNTVVYQMQRTANKIHEIIWRSSEFRKFINDFSLEVCINPQIQQSAKHRKVAITMPHHRSS